MKRHTTPFSPPPARGTEGVRQLRTFACGDILAGGDLRLNADQRICASSRTPLTRKRIGPPFGVWRPVPLREG